MIAEHDPSVTRLVVVLGWIAQDMAPEEMAEPLEIICHADATR